MLLVTPWASQDRCEVMIYCCEQLCVHIQVFEQERKISNQSTTLSQYLIILIRQQSAHSGSQQEVGHLCDAADWWPLALLFCVSLVIILFVSWWLQTQILCLRAKAQKAHPHGNRVSQATMFNRGDVPLLEGGTTRCVSLECWKNVFKSMLCDQLWVWDGGNRSRSEMGDDGRRPGKSNVTPPLRAAAVEPRLGCCCQASFTLSSVNSEHIKAKALRTSEIRKTKHQSAFPTDPLMCAFSRRGNKHKYSVTWIKGAVSKVSKYLFLTKWPHV